MNPNRQNAKPEFKVCAGKECQKKGIHSLKILYLHKSGWFCDYCKNNLLDAGLVYETNANMFCNTDESNENNNQIVFR